MKAVVVTPEQKLKELGLSLPNPRKESGNYVGCVRTGNLSLQLVKVQMNIVENLGKMLRLK